MSMALLRVFLSDCQLSKRQRQEVAENIKFLYTVAKMTVQNYILFFVPNGFKFADFFSTF